MDDKPSIVIRAYPPAHEYWLRGFFFVSGGGSAVFVGTLILKVIVWAANFLT